MSLDNVSLQTNQKKEPNGPPFPSGAARDGVSIATSDGAVVLGNDVGDPLTPALLTENREIPSANGEEIAFTTPSLDPGIRTRISSFYIIMNAKSSIVPSEIAITDADSGNAVTLAIQGDGLPKLIWSSNQVVFLPSGNFKIGTVTDNGQTFQVDGDGLFKTASGGNNDQVEILTGNLAQIILSNDDWTGDSPFIKFVENLTGTNFNLEAIVFAGNNRGEIRFFSGVSGNTAVVVLTEAGNIQVGGNSGGAADTGSRLQVDTDVQIGQVSIPNNPSAIVGWDLTNKKITKKGTTGSAIFSGTGVIVTFAVTHGLGATPTQVEVTATSAAAASLFFVSAKTGTQFSVTYLVAPGIGVNNITFDWTALTQ